MQVLRVAAAAHRRRNDVVELQLCPSAALPAPATVPHPRHLLDVVRDDVAPLGLVLWLPAYCSHRLGSFDAAALSLLL